MRPSWSPCSFFGQRDRTVFDAEGVVQPAAAAGDGVGGERPSSGDLHLLVDSTGIKMMGEGEWKTRKHGASYRRQWRKVYIGIDAETLDIRAIEVTTNAIEMPLSSRSVGAEPGGRRSAALWGRRVRHKKCHAAIAEREAQAIIPV